MIPGTVDYKVGLLPAVAYIDSFFDVAEYASLEYDSTFLKLQD